VSEGFADVVLRRDQQKLCLCQVHLGEAQIEVGFELVIHQRRDLIAYHLALVDRLLGHLEQCLGPQHLEESLVHRQQHVIARRLRILLRGLRLQP
jgi:hypothetical protein